MIELISRRVGYNHLISRKPELSNCFIKNSTTNCYKINKERKHEKRDKKGTRIVQMTFHCGTCLIFPENLLQVVQFRHSKVLRS